MFPLFLTMPILLGLVAAFIELRTAFSIPFIRRAIEKFSVLGVVFSIVLSIFIGGIFGSAGLVVMLGAMLATTITQPVYMVAGKVKKSGHDVAQTINGVKDTAREVRAVFSLFGRMFILAFKIMVAPFWLLYKILSWNAKRTQTA